MRRSTKLLSYAHLIIILRIRLCMMSFFVAKVPFNLNFAKAVHCAQDPKLQ